jgi:hypothetical protein
MTFTSISTNVSRAAKRTAKRIAKRVGYEQTATMERTYQHPRSPNGVGRGFAVAGGGVQCTVTLLPVQRDKLAKLAERARISLAEQIRRSLNEALGL